MIFYHPEGYDLGGKKIMGRQAAGHSFLGGYLNSRSNKEVCAYIENENFKTNFFEQAKAEGFEGKVTFLDRDAIGQLGNHDALYYPGPNFSNFAYQRTAFSPTAWSCCGITHTTSSAAAMDSIAGYLTAPVMPWDALICTSKAVKENVLRLLQVNADFLSERLGIQKIVLPELPIIPLGVNTQQFYIQGKDKKSARSKLNVSADDVLILYMGRLSFHAKAHPLPLYQALEAAQRDTGCKIILLEAGWYPNETIKQSYANAAQSICPSVEVKHLDGRKAENRELAWAAADIFSSFADNIQETFGITPVEAMAAAMPVVVSDWNGYKDTVRDGEDGYRIPTTMPNSGLGTDLALRHAMGIDSYDVYCGHTSSLVAVDINAATEAFKRLISDPPLRRKMGAAAQKRAKAIYDWSKIIPRYEELWRMLRERRNAQKTKEIDSDLVYNWPNRPDPFKTFSHYASSVLKETTELELNGLTFEEATERLKELGGLFVVNYAKYVQPSPDEIHTLLSKIKTGRMTAVDLVEGIPKDRRGFVFRSIVWLLKLGILKIVK